MKNKYTYTIIITIITIIFYYANDYLDKKNEEYPKDNMLESISKNEFDATFLPSSTTGSIINHDYYTLSYSESHEQAEWVAYELKKNQIKKGSFKRPYFVEDKKVKTHSADWKNYKKSGYDKGHLCPAGDRNFNYNAFHETFLTSNISPQNSSFNKGIWNNLEQKVRRWAKEYDGVYVVTGGVLKENLKTIGYERVSVPEMYYKIIMDSSNGNYKAIAFLIPNQDSNLSFYKYVVTIDEIEVLTGIDFFPNLDSVIEDKLESEISLKTWKKH